MAKFTTRVAGVTYYNVDFTSIKKSSRVQIVPEPDCPYDDNALKVMINGKHVGYLKRGFNRTIWREIKNGSKVSARVKAVIGGKPGQNHGIALSIIVDDGLTAARHGDDLGPRRDNSANGIIAFRASFPGIPSYKTEDLWIKFWEYKNKLPPLVGLPREPIYRDDYDRDVPILKRLWSENFNSYRARRRKEWLELCAKPKAQNEKRYRLIKELNATRSKVKADFDSYVRSFKMMLLLDTIHAHVPNFERASNPSPYVTVYERSIYDLLKKKVSNTFHQVTIDGSSIDILCIPEDLSNVWAIEIDGGIHQLEKIIGRDNTVQRKLKRLGVSLIRIPNYMVSRSAENCVEQILDTIGVNERKQPLPST